MKYAIAKDRFLLEIILATQFRTFTKIGKVQITRQNAIEHARVTFYGKRVWNMQRAMRGSTTHSWAATFGHPHSGFRKLLDVCMCLGFPDVIRCLLVSLLSISFDNGVPLIYAQSCCHTNIQAVTPKTKRLSNDYRRKNAAQHAPWLCRHCHHTT